jgi:hypothetical protein
VRGIEARRQRKREAFLDFDMAGEAAKAANAGLFLGGAQVLLVSKAPFAASARARLPTDSDAGSNAQPPDIAARTNDFTHDFVPRNNERVPGDSQ